MEALRKVDFPQGAGKQLGESREDQAKGVRGERVCTHIFVHICKSRGFSYIYEEKCVYLSQCYEDGVLVLLLFYYVSNKEVHQRKANLECRVAVMEKGICKLCVH